MQKILLAALVVAFSSSAAWPSEPLPSSPLPSQISAPSCGAPLAGDQEQAASRPFVKLLNFHVSGLPVVPAPYSESGALICRDRQLLRIGFFGVVPDDALVAHSAQVGSGRVTSAEWRALTEAAGAARIGLPGAAGRRASVARCAPK